MLCILPARGGSKGIPGKNVRNVAGKPLLLHTLHTLRAAGMEQIVVSTDCPTIASVARLHGYEVQPRPAHLAADDTTVAQVAEHVTRTLGWTGPVGVFQPTSPTLRPESVRAARKALHGYASLCSVTPDTKLRWDTHGPLFHARVNRQQADPEWRETGAIQMAQACPVGPTDPLVGHPHHLFVLPPDEAHDIDTPDDLEAARRHLARGRVNVVLTAGRSVGAGHLFRVLAIADELHHRIGVVASASLPPWARERIRAAGVHLEGWAYPDLVIADRLDTSAQEVAGWKATGAKVVTLEDLGSGAPLADLVVNELYASEGANVVSGPRWAVLRPEFLGLDPVTVTEKRRVLVMFGGTDPAHLSERVSQVAAREANVTVLLGPGAQPREFASGVRVVREAPVAELIRNHDVVVTSAGRTVHEVAACGVPVVSIAANERESRHSHCAGVLRLGLHVTLPNEVLQETVYRLLGAPDLREEMAVTARAQVDGLGARRVAHRVDGILEGL